MTAFDNLLQSEKIAHTVQHYAIGNIPGLLQTPEFAAALIQDFVAYGYDKEEIIRKRMLRQSILLNPAQQFYFVLNEDVLYHEIGGKEILQNQIGKLIEISSTIPNVSIQILPFSSPSGAALTFSFVLTTTSYSQSLYIETVPYAPDFYGKPGPAEDVFRKLQAYALDKYDSLVLLQQRYDALQ